MNYLNGEAIIGFFVAVGGVAIVLQRFGILKMPITRKSNQDNPKNNNDRDKKITSLKEVQIVQAEILKQHAERFDKGDERFGKLETVIGGISVNVGILLDRTKS